MSDVCNKKHQSGAGWEHCTTGNKGCHLPVPDAHRSASFRGSWEGPGKVCSAPVLSLSLSPLELLLPELQCLCDKDRHTLGIKPTTGRRRGEGRAPPWPWPIDSFARVSLPEAGSFPSLGAWAGCQLVPVRGGLSYPITSLRSQLVPQD